MKQIEHGCSAQFKVVAFRETDAEGLAELQAQTDIVIGNVGGYSHRFVDMNSHLVIVSLFRRLILSGVGEEYLPLFSAASATGVFAFDRFGPSLKPESFLTTEGIKTFKRHNCRPVIHRAGISEQANGIWKTSLPLQIEIVSNFLRAVDINKRHVFSTDALARQFWAVAVVSLLNMAGNSLFSERNSPGRVKYQAGPYRDSRKTNEALVAVHPFSSMQERLKDILLISGIFSAASAVSVIAEMSGHHEYWMIAAACSILSTAPSIYYMTQAGNVPPNTDYSLELQARNKELYLENSEKFTTVSKHHYDGKRNFTEFSIFQTLLFLFIEIICSDQINKKSASDPDTLFSRYMILYLVMVTFSTLTGLLFGRNRVTHIESVEKGSPSISRRMANNQDSPETVV